MDINKAEAKKLEVVDKWAVVVGIADPSGDPGLHLHRIYEDKQYAIRNLSDIKDLYPVAFVQAIKCTKDLD